MGFPWWLGPLYIAMKLFHAVTYPVAVLPFHLACTKDLWGNEPPETCLSYHCPKLKALGPNLPNGIGEQCEPWEQWQ